MSARAFVVIALAALTGCSAATPPPRGCPLQSRRQQQAAEYHRQQLKLQHELQAILDQLDRNLKVLESLDHLTETLGVRSDPETLNQIDEAREQADELRSLLDEMQP